jgi:hypothetical protein
MDFTIMSATEDRIEHPGSLSYAFLFGQFLVQYRRLYLSLQLSSLDRPSPVMRPVCVQQPQPSLEAIPS